jgi:hypothetical protein
MIFASIWYPLETVALTALSDLSEQRYSRPDDILERSTLLYPLFCLEMMAQTVGFGAFTAVAEVSRLA